ncbi:hypothetical protein AXG93_4874s1300 [Marchantia polymorpha subsp. ruderalis]|uniref:Uncharacterized protein n=1 Tax=Marchantia polymorpha subsp. ruderalis TaxID=1480154 RepID=A0A176WHI7_MARPO|nr:hypothetical protein AXG93_4874s1300 [Marchantia polymorpha subsp. ruderalis]
MDLCGRLETSREAYKTAVQREKRLIGAAEKREQLHAKELAKVEVRRAEEARIAEDLQGQIAAAKTEEEELRSKITKLTNDRDKEFKRPEELTASLAEELWKHKGELTDWAKKLADCSDVDLLFEKSSVGLTRIEESSYEPLFSSGRSGTNGWKTADYQDPKRRTIALGIMHILRTQRTTYVTAWQVGFFERVLKGQRTTAREPVQVDVLPNREKPERRLAKRGKVVTDDEEDLTLVVRRAETEVEGIRQSRARARSKRKASRRFVVTEVSDSSVEKTVVPIVDPPKVATGESTQPVVIEVPSAVLVKVPADVTVESSKEGTEMVSPNSISSERTRFVGSEEVPQSKTSEELAKELTLSEEILEQVVVEVGGTVVDATDITLPSSPVEDVRPKVEKKTSEEESKGVDVTFPGFLQDSVVPILKYLDGKREKYVLSKEVGFYVELVRNRTQIKRVVAVKRKWDSATEIARE